MSHSDQEYAETLVSFCRICRLVAYFNAQGLMAVTALKAFPVIVLTSFVCTGIESIPATYVDDNISVPIAAGIVAYMLWNMPVFGIVAYS